MLWRYRTREKWHKGIAPLLLAFLKKLLISKVAKKAGEATGEAGSGQLISAIAGGIGKGGKVPDKTIGKTSGGTDIIQTDRTFEEQLQFKPPETTGQPLAPQIPPQILTNSQGFAAPLSTQQVQEQFAQNRTPSIPQNIPQPLLQPTQPTGQATAPTIPPGIFAGLKEGILNLPSEGFGKIPAGRIGRKAAFATGETIGDFLRSNLLSLPTADPQSATVPVLDPQTGKVVFQKPRGSVFQPRPQTETEAERIFSKLVEEDALGGEQKVGDIVDKGGKKWKIVGFDKDGEPLVEEIK